MLNALTIPVNSITNMLWSFASLRPLPKGMQNSVFTFQLRYGRPFTLTDASFGCERGAPKNCFRNAAHLALAQNLIYVEGYVTCYGLPIEHAWCCDVSGNLIEPTLRHDNDQPTRLYFGVPIKRDFLATTLMRRGVYGILDCNRSLYRMSQARVKRMVVANMAPQV